MNVQEIVPDSGETLARFFAVALPLTFLTVWIIVALQSQYLYGRDRVSLLTRLAWPAYLAKVFWDRKFNPNGRGPGRDGMGGYDPDEDENVGIYGTRMMLEEKTKWTPRLRHPNNAPRPSGELYTRTRAPGNV
ncbi:hypothetical protein AX16_003811 [Volvariella volvacea WC 439]|nr:hypothetical protein AX16_003811 [Volvariella volvacea WC 439]